MTLHAYYFLIWYMVETKVFRIATLFFCSFGYRPNFAYLAAWLKNNILITFYPILYLRYAKVGLATTLWRHSKIIYSILLYSISSVYLRCTFVATNILHGYCVLPNIYWCIYYIAANFNLYGKWKYLVPEVLWAPWFPHGMQMNIAHLGHNNHWNHKVESSFTDTW